MTGSSTRVVKMIDRMYQIIGLSFSFWKVLLKKRVIYGWLAALRYLLKETYALHGSIEQDKTAISLSYSRGISFFMTSSLSLITCGFLTMDSTIGLFLFIIGIAGITFLLPFSIFYLLEEMTFPQVEKERLVYWAIGDFWRESKLVVFIISCSLLLMFSFFINKILFICFMPGIFGEMIFQIFTRTGMKRKRGE